MPNKSWRETFADLIVDHIWSNEKLKELMLIPKNATIIDFIEKYFIKAGTSTTPLVDEQVRIVYGIFDAWSQGDSHVMKKEISFDIYVKNTVSHNSSSNRLVYRAEEIADLLKHILTHGERYLSGSYRFWCIGDTDMMSTVAGYTRHNVSFQFIQTV